jgi:hypothetical protein
MGAEGGHFLAGLVQIGVQFGVGAGFCQAHWRVSSPVAGFVVRLGSDQGREAGQEESQHPLRTCHLSHALAFRALHQAVPRKAAPRKAGTTSVI